MSIPERMTVMKPSRTCHPASKASRPPPKSGMDSARLLPMAMPVRAPMAASAP